MANKIVWPKDQRVVAFYIDDMRRDVMLHEFVVHVLNELRERHDVCVTSENSVALTELNRAGLRIEAHAGNFPHGRLFVTAKIGSGIEVASIVSADAWGRVIPS